MESGHCGRDQHASQGERGSGRLAGHRFATVTLKASRCASQNCASRSARHHTIQDPATAAVFHKPCSSLLAKCLYLLWLFRCNRWQAQKPFCTALQLASGGVGTLLGATRLLRILIPFKS